jgi:glycosyltransferase involved in cell wall biosynthesis
MSRSTASPDVSVVVTAHREGTLCHPTLRSVWRAVDYAQSRGVSAEVLVVLDRPDDATRDYFARHPSGAAVHEVDFGDPGPARNHGARVAAGKYVSFLDGDDLYCSPWLERAFRQAVAAATPCVCHPLYTVLFGTESAVWRHLSSSDVAFRTPSLLEINHWGPWALMPRELLLRCPYRPCPRGSGFGFEDWHWYCEVVAAGVPVVTVDQTCLFYRRRIASRMWEHVQAEAVLPPSTLFDRAAFPARVVEGRSPRAEEAIRLTPNPPVQGPLAALARRGVKMVLRRCLPHRVRHGLRALIRPEPRGAAGPRLPPLPAWLLAEWRRIHPIEPQLFPDAAFFDSAFYHTLIHPVHSHLGEAYADFCRRLPPDVSHLLLVPWLKTGGSDRTALNYARALVENGLGKGIAMVATEDNDSPWAKNLPPSVSFVEFGRLYRHLTDRQRQLLLARWLLQASPAVAHNLNSKLGYELMLKHGRALRQTTRLYCHVFCDNLTPEGQYVGYNRFLLPACMEALTGVLSDNQTELDRLVDTFALDLSKLRTHYQPIEVGPPPCPRAPTGCLEVLWAGRLDRQKRPDLLAQIARACLDYPIRFHVYGSSVIEGDRSPIPEGPNVEYHGPYDGFGSLPTERYDVFLYTSQWDGLPNVLLEAMAAHLPVVASAVGGVSELVVPGKTGFLVEPFDDVDGYVQALLEVHRHRDDVARYVENGVKLLQRRHSWEAFVQAIRETPGYVVTPAGGRRDDQIAA